MYLKRLAELTLREVISGVKVGIVLGARQVGKTTLVEHALQGAGALFLNFDVEVDKARFRAAAALPPADALRSFGNPPVLVIDEAQRLPEAPRIVKGWFDARLPVRFLLLGSSSLDLLDQAAESLTGPSFTRGALAARRSALSVARAPRGFARRHAARSHRRARAPSRR